MLNLKKEVNVLKSDELSLGTCPVCGSYVSHVYFMQDIDSKVSSKWYSCSCGIIWNIHKPGKVYDRKYWDSYNHTDNKLKDAYEYPVRIYTPIIEELIYGRRVLIIGRTTNHQEDEFKRRGWVPTVIDKNISFESHNNLIVDDFEKHKFPENLKYNLIWIYHTLECFHDPIESLSLCKTLLAEDGIIYIASPDTDFINTRASAGFIHWKPDMHYMMWNRRSISTYLEKLGFTIILCRQNYEHRFPVWDDFHLIAQKRFF